MSEGIGLNIDYDEVRVGKIARLSNVMSVKRFYVRLVRHGGNTRISRLCETVQGRG